MQSTAPKPLSTAEFATWGGFLRTHARLVRELDEELRREHNLPLSSYDVLAQIENAGEWGLRMSGLADAVMLSRSGLTRLVDRLEDDGLLERRECPDDARGLYAAITELGRERLSRARATHLEGVRRLFLERLDEDERRRLAATWARLAERPAAT
jgi:DNA-binding MarR family transcriptional regulator